MQNDNQLSNQQIEEISAIIRGLKFYVSVLANNEEKSGFVETAESLRELVERANAVLESLPQP